MKKEKQFVQAIFCAPTGRYADKPYPSRLTDEVFSALAEIGINRIFAFGYDGRKETVESTFNLCEKYDMLYYPTPVTANEYTRILPGKNGEKPFSELTETEVMELDQKFIKEIEPMTKREAFGGIFFSDEKGYLAFEGIAHAKKVFDENFGEFEFHVNFYSYSINDDIFWGGMGGVAPDKLPFRLEGDMEITFANRFNYYDRLVEGMLSKAPFKFMSQDKYPFENFWPTVPTSVHVALFELNAYFNEKKKKYGNKFYNYMQVGEWNNSGRNMTFAEMALQMHVTAAYGSDGFAYFPGCFPIDFAEDRGGSSERGEGGAAFIDINGNPTIYCEWVQMLNQFFCNIEEDILSSEFLGVTSFGEYSNNFTLAEIEKLPDNECIFRGTLPDVLQGESDLQVQSSNQVLVSTFQREDKKRYYFVNLSTVHENEVKVQLPEGKYQVYDKEGHHRSCAQMGFKLDAGCGTYIVEE